jgi:uncharacterized protein YcbX
MGLVLTSKGNAQKLVLPITQADAEVLQRYEAQAEVLDVLDNSQYITADDGSEGPGSKASQWFEASLGISGLSLVEGGMSGGTGEEPSGTHFANAPSTLLLVSTASLREFGRLCGLAVPANRFRANLEVAFEKSFAEDAWAVGDCIDIGPAEFEAAGRCVRCQAVDVDPDTGVADGPSLLAALATQQFGSGKGPTFGVLLRFRSVMGGKMTVLSVGMRVSPDAKT